VTSRDRRRIATVIARAENGTTGRIAVRIVPDETVDAFDRAKSEFERVGMQRHPYRNAALILVAPRARRFAVLGDRALHERVDETFWRDVVAKMQPLFARGDIADAIVCGVERLGSAFREHFSAGQTP
jgi:uncharacterized membrane protein